jgi:hypothetical protein
MLHLLLSNGTLVFLSADSASVRSAWHEHIQAAIAGGSAAEGAHVGGPGAPPTQAPVKLASQGSEESCQPEAADQHGGPVPRKISTAVFGEDLVQATPAAPVAEEDGGSEQGAAAEEALLAAILAASAERQPTEQEAAVVALVLAAAASYVEAAAERLQGLTQRLVSAGMLLERREALRQHLLGLLLEGGVQQGGGLAVD